ncbi:MAG: hypothetical protein GF404_00650 [candidate division Zixibacteria bacterium]|nr:hypothetical protein [candidate division Zixibacteria bacterium]
MRTGTGIAFYKFDPDKPLLLAGVTLTDFTGLSGNNDSDILSHVVCDAVLGAAGLGGMSQQFDESDSKYRDIKSIKLLELARIKLEKLSLEVVNLDIILVAKDFDLANFRTMITVNLQHALLLENGSVSLKTAPSIYPLISFKIDGMAALATCSVTEVYEDDEGNGFDRDEENGEDYYE